MFFIFNDTIDFFSCSEKILLVVFVTMFCRFLNQIILFFKDFLNVINNDNACHLCDKIFCEYSCEKCSSLGFHLSCPAIWNSFFDSRPDFIVHKIWCGFSSRLDNFLHFFNEYFLSSLDPFLQKYSPTPNDLLESSFIEWF